MYHILSIFILLTLHSTQLAFACAQHHLNCTEEGASRNETSAQDILSKAAAALGGQDVLSQVTGIKMQAPNIFRSQTLTQSYKLSSSDEFLAVRGSQNISFDYSQGYLQQVVDREYSLSDYWVWALPSLSPQMSFSLVVKDDPAVPLAWFRNGSNCLLNGPSSLGYADQLLTAYLVGDAQKSDPLLVYRLMDSSQVRLVLENVNGRSLPAVYSESLGISLICDSHSMLPWIVRRSVYNKIFGHSLSDLYLTDYRPIPVPGTNSSLLLPHRHQTVFNDESVLEDTVFETFTVNPSFDNDIFTLQTGSQDAHAAPYEIHLAANLSSSDVGAFYEAALWSGEMSQNLDQVNATHPEASLPQVWQLAFHDGLGNESGYTQLVVELEDAVIVTDATAHLSQPLLQWVHDTIRKPVKYLFLTHHHHDHSYAIADYVAAGAKVVVPEVARSYWGDIPNAEFVFYNDTHPWIVSDGKVQARGIWKPGAPHAEDWAWMVVARNCPNSDDDERDKMVIFEADVFNPDGQGQALRYDLGFARQWLRSLEADRVRSNTVIAAAHGLTRPLQELIDVLAYPYPDFTTNDFAVGGPLCLSSMDGVKL